MRMDGRVVLVTGGAAGIGAAVCRRVVAEGGVAVAADLAGDRAEALAAEVPGIAAVTLDVTDGAAVDAAVARVAEEHGRLDVLVNSAGAGTREESEALLPRIRAQAEEAAAGAVTTALESTVALTDDQWRRVVGSHLDGTFHCTRAALRVMGRQRSGAIVNVASICGLVGCAGAAHYSAAKGAVLAFTRAVAKEVIVQGIRVNAVAPGWTDTDRLDYFSDEMRRQRIAQTPIGRFASADEIAASVVFLASDDASFFVGDTLSPNGGAVTA